MKKAAAEINKDKSSNKEVIVCFRKNSREGNDVGAAGSCFIAYL